MPWRTDITSDTTVRMNAQIHSEFAIAILIGLRPSTPAIPAIGITARISATRASSHAQARLLMYDLFGVGSRKVCTEFDILPQ